MTGTRPQFFGERLRIGRVFHGLTRAELGERVAASHAFIYQLEVGTRQPSEVMVDALAESLQFAPDFFTMPITEEFRDDECNFRRRMTTPVGVRNQALAHGTLFGMVVAYLENLLKLPKENLPEIPKAHFQDPERAAELSRMHWGLGLDRPITSMTRVLEQRAGAVVTHFEGTSEKVDAFSRAGRRAVVVANIIKANPSRTRFDLAHELGHLVLHRGVETGTPEREAEADRFASAFLLPRAGILREFPKVPRIHWNTVLDMKKRWGASMAAVVRRAYDLRVIDAVRYRNACIYIRKRGWHKGEPGEAASTEQPETVTLAFQALERKAGVTPHAVAYALRWHPAVLERVAGVRVPQGSPEAIKAGGIVRLDDHRRGR